VSFRLSRALALLAKLPVVLEAVTCASAHATAQQMQLRYLISRDGRGVLLANIWPDDRGVYHWLRCPPGGGQCMPVAASFHNQQLNVGDAQPGTVYVVTGTHGRTTSTARSRIYLGHLDVRRRPTVRGLARAGAFIRPIRGRWSGGWGNESDRLQLQACRSRSGRGCIVLSDSVYQNDCPGSGAVIDAPYIGRFLRVLDERIGRDTAFASNGYLPGHVAPIAPRPDTATRVIGRIGPATAQHTKPPRCSGGAAVTNHP
jgi:hypothetical protein